MLWDKHKFLIDLGFNESELQFKVNNAKGSRLRRCYFKCYYWLWAPLTPLTPVYLAFYVL